MPDDDARKPRRVVSKRIRKGTGGVNAVIAANVGDAGSTRTSVTSRQRIVQKDGKTHVYEEREERSE